MRSIGLIRAIPGLLMICLGTTSNAQNVLALPAPTGPFSIGRMTFYWKDASRPETNTADPSDHRELRVDVWYPAQTAPNAKEAAYCADLAALGKKLGGEGILFASMKTHSFVAPPIVQGGNAYPTLVFSPGNATNAENYTALVEELVSHGYAVATVDHPFQSKAI